EPAVRGESPAGATRQSLTAKQLPVAIEVLNPRQHQVGDIERVAAPAQLVDPRELAGTLALAAHLDGGVRGGTQLEHRVGGGPSHQVVRAGGKMADHSVSVGPRH